VYTEKVEALMVSSYTDIRLEDGVIRLIDIYRASITGLKPCTKYYARLKFLISKLTPVPAPTICFEYRYGEEISFTTTGCSIGTGSHQSGGISAVAPSNRPFILSNIVVQGATVAAARVSPGEKVDVTATVANRGGSNGTSKVTLYINGQEAESKGITLSSGESTQVHFSVSRNDPGTYSIYVNGVPAGSITVDLFTNNDILIYSIIALFSIGIVGVLYLVFKRRPA
jgi:hypothetical protein